MKKFFSCLTAGIFMLVVSSGSAVAAEAMGFNMSGFVDSSFFYNSDADGTNGADMNTFGLDQVEIDISKEIKDWASLRFDINYMPSSGVANTDDAIIEQGYLTLTAPVNNGTTFTFGKFNAPIGFELLDPVDMYQFSHALVFNFGLPSNLIGAMLSTSFGSVFDVSGYVANGWDNEPDTNKNKTFGGRLGVTPMEGFNFGISGITGNDGPTTADNLSVLDIDATVTVIPKLTLGAEFNFGWETVTGAADNDWFGLLIMAHYDFLDWAGLTFRYDYFDDETGGTRLTRAVATPDTRQAITISPTFVIADGFGALVEYRHDFSNKNVFATSSGTATDNNDTFAVEMTYAF